MSGSRETRTVVCSRYKNAETYEMKINLEIGFKTTAKPLIFNAVYFYEFAISFTIRCPLILQFWQMNYFAAV